MFLNLALTPVVDGIALLSSVYQANKKMSYIQQGTHILFLELILTMLGATETIMPYALTYARIYVFVCY